MRGGLGAVAALVLVALYPLGAAQPATAESELLAHPDFTFAWPGLVEPASSRMSASNRTLLLDGHTALLRGVTYSPTPIGKDMSSPNEEERVADFFVPENAAVWRRDLPLMQRMGVNAIRVYELNAHGDHTAFLDLAYELNITVLAGFPLLIGVHQLHVGDVVGDADLGSGIDGILQQQQQQSSPLDIAATQSAVRAAVRHNAHPAIGMWLIGNEVNLFSNGFVCASELCPFGDDVVAAYAAVDALCAVVEAEGQLCSSPLSDTPLPQARYETPFGSQVGWQDFTAHVRLLDNVTTHFHAWVVNTYRGAGFGALFSDYAKVSGKPLLLGEYGVDAFDTCAMATDENAQMRYTLSLVEHLERHSTACVGDACGERIASGGLLMSWVDELWKGHGSLPAGCPDGASDVQTPCGGLAPGFPDLFMNEEYWGLVAPSRACGDAGAGAPDRLRPRLAYAALALLCREGGCTPLDAVGGGGVALANRSYDVGAYPTCGLAVKLVRDNFFPAVGAPTSCGDANRGVIVEAAYVSDCDIMRQIATGFYAFTTNIPSSACPLPPAHMRRALNESAATELAAFPTAAECEHWDPFPGINLTNYPLLAQNRMMPHGRALWLDGAPLLVRGICYSPVPVGHDPGYGEPWGDYFTTEYYEIFQRDIKLFVEMGANTIRLYTFKTSERHKFFLDAADEAGLIVMGAFEIGTAEHTSLATFEDRNKVKVRLSRQIRFSYHRALTLWFVGNEMNGPWQGFVCESFYATKYLTFAGTECQFKNNASS